MDSLKHECENHAGHLCLTTTENLIESRNPRKVDADRTHFAAFGHILLYGT